MRDYGIVSLDEILSNLTEEEVQVRLNKFVCTRDADRQDFLRNKAVMFEKKGMARTYLALSDGNIMGYFTISIRCLRIPDDQNISKSLSKKMNVDPDNNVAQSYLVGQLAKANGTYDGLGAELLEEAVDIVKDANKLVGCRVIRVDCADGLIHFYETHGFRHLCITEATESKPSINQMVQVI